MIDVGGGCLDIPAVETAGFKMMFAVLWLKLTTLDLKSPVDLLANNPNY